MRSPMCRSETCGSCIPAMRQDWQKRFPSVTASDLHELLDRINQVGPLTIRDIADDVLNEKTHAWR